MRWYTLPGWPARVNGHTAAMPVPALPPGSAVHYKGDTTGYPGTMGVPVKPVIPSPDIGDAAQMGISRSGDAPNMIYPNQYWARPEPHYWPGAGMPNAPLQVPLNLRGIRNIRQPALLIQWPDYP